MDFSFIIPVFITNKLFELKRRVAHFSDLRALGMRYNDTIDEISVFYYLMYTFLIFYKER